MRRRSGRRSGDLQPQASKRNQKQIRRQQSQLFQVQQQQQQQQQHQRQPHENEDDSDDTGIMLWSNKTHKI